MEPQALFLIVISVKQYLNVYSQVLLFIKYIEMLIHYNGRQYKVIQTAFCLFSIIAKCITFFDWYVYRWVAKLQQHCKILVWKTGI